MPSTESSDETARTVGPVRLLPTSLPRQLLGLALVTIGVQVLGWAVEATSAGSLVPAILYTGLATFVALNGLALGGVRPR